jgi:1A family penicillin-binding protein
MRRWMLVGGVMLMAIIAGYGAYRTAAFTISVVGDLDNAATLTEFGPRAQATLAFDRGGGPAFSFFVEQRIDVPLKSVSPHMIDAILAVEDRRFYSHFGLDPIRMAGAAWQNLKADRIVEGGSTLTQQLARAAQLSRARTYERKMREVLLAATLEERYSKDQILEHYLNTVYFGEGYYGVEAAARGYFGKSASGLDPAEGALLAALVRAPSRDAPCVSPKRALARRNLVLRLMREQGRIGEDAYRTAARSHIPNRSHQAALSASATSGTGMYFQEELRRQLFSMFGAERVLRGGLRVYTTYDPAMQREAETAIATRIAQIIKMRPRARDLQGSLVAMDPESGDVLALVGGRDFGASSFNRATQARRQAGSAFKPIIYAAALERGYAPGSLLRGLDTPIQDLGGAWLPGGEHERSEYTLRRALKVSSNRAAAQLLQQVGVSTAVYYAHRLGIASELPMVPSLALGTGEVTLLELTTAYSAFANQGLVAPPRLIKRVEDLSGTAIYVAPETHTRAISPATAYLMSSMLSDVVSSGTATGARAAGFTLPAAGKTGTTDDYADAWFVGYTPHLIAGVWFGLDRPAPIMRGGFGGIVAVPAWAQFMRNATEGAKPDWYAMPDGIEKVAICRVSGARATEACRNPVPPPPTFGDALASIGVVQYPADVQAAALPPPPLEQPVYEDLFPVGTVSPEPCPLHNTVTDALSSMSTPLVDTALQQSLPATENSEYRAVVPVAATRLVVERVLQPDGTFRTIVRQRR